MDQKYIYIYRKLSNKFEFKFNKIFVLHSLIEWEEKKKKKSLFK